MSRGEELGSPWTWDLRYPPLATDTYWWPPKHVRLASAWYASYWNVFLLNVVKVSPGGSWGASRREEDVLMSPLAQSAKSFIQI